MTYSGEGIRHYLSCFSQAMIWFEPVFAHNLLIEDFRFMYFNQAALQYIGLSEHELKGVRVSKASFMDDWLELKLLEELKEVYLTNKASEGVLFNTVLKKQAHVRWRKMFDGVIARIADVSTLNH